MKATQDKSVQPVKPIFSASTPKESPDSAAPEPEKFSKAWCAKMWREQIRPLAIMLIALEGLSYDEAAWILGVPIGTLRSRLSRGRETLRTLQVGTLQRDMVRRIK